MFFGKKIALCFGDVGQRIGLGDDRADLVRLDVADQVLEHLVFLEGAAKKREVFEVERADIQFGDRSGDGPGTGIAPAKAQHVEELRP